MMMIFLSVLNGLVAMQQRKYKPTIDLKEGYSVVLEV